MSSARAKRGAERGIEDLEMSKNQEYKNVDVEDVVHTPIQDATTTDVAVEINVTGAVLDLVRAGTVSEMKSEMCEAMASLARTLFLRRQWV